MSSPQQTTPVKRARKQNRAKEVIVAEKAAKVARKQKHAEKKKMVAAEKEVKSLARLEKKLAKIAEDQAKMDAVEDHKFWKAVALEEKD